MWDDDSMTLWAYGVGFIQGAGFLIGRESGEGKFGNALLGFLISIPVSVIFTSVYCCVNYTRDSIPRWRPEPNMPPAQNASDSRIEMNVNQPLMAPAQNLKNCEVEVHKSNTSEMAV